MSLVLDTGTMKYRQNPNQPWRPLVIKAGMNWESMADTYDPDNGTYEVGQYVLEEGMMYRCISEITTPETWTPAHWTSVNVGDELSSFIIISDDQPTDETNKIWIAETTAPFGVQIPTMDDHNALGNTLNQLDQNMAYAESGDTASRTYVVGDFISWKGTLYTASAAIPMGDPFSVGTNLVAVVGGGFNALNINSGSGYCKFPDGTMVQWGVKATNTTGWVFDVSMPQSFINTNYVVVCSNATTANAPARVAPDTANSFDLTRSNVDNADNFNWIAIGRWK